VNQTQKWSSLAAAAVLAAVTMMGVGAKPAMANADSQNSQNWNGGQSGGQNQYGQPNDSRGRGDWNSQNDSRGGRGDNYDNGRQGGHRGGNYDNGGQGGQRGGSCSNNGYSNNRGGRSNYNGTWQDWNRSHGQDRRWKSRSHNRDRRTNQGWSDRGKDQGYRGGY